METIETLIHELGIDGVNQLENLHLLTGVQLAMIAYCKDHYKPAYSIVEDGPVQSKIITEQKLVKPRKQRILKGVAQPPATPPAEKKKRGGRKLGAKNKPKPDKVAEVKEVKEVKPWPDNVYHNAGPGRPRKVNPIVENVVGTGHDLSDSEQDLLDDPKPKKEKIGYPPMVVTNPDKITMKDVAGKSDHTQGKIRFQVNPRTWIWIDPKLSKKEREALKEKYSLESVVVGATTNGLSDGKEFVSTFNK